MDKIKNQDAVTTGVDEKLRIGNLSMKEVIAITGAESTRDTHERRAGENPVQTETPPAQSQPLTPPPKLEPDEVDLKYFRERDDIVKRGIKASIELARALHEIYTYRDGLLWKHKYGSYAHCCQEVWGISRSHSYRLLEIGGLVQAMLEVSPNGDWLPRSEGQIRPLIACVAEEHRVECWKLIVAETNPTNLTGAMVQEKVQKFAKDKDWAKKKEPVPAITPEQRALSEIEKLQKVLGKLPNPEVFNPILASITALIKKDNPVIEVQATATESPAQSESGELETTTDPTPSAAQPA